MASQSKDTKNNTDQGNTAWRKALGQVMRTKMLERLMKTSINDQKLGQNTEMIEASATEDQSNAREVKRQAFIKQAMEYFENPIFKKMLLKDLHEQEKYFNNEPPPVPSDWMKEGAAFMNSTAKTQSQFAIEKISNMPGNMIQRIQDEYSSFKNRHDVEFRSGQGEDNIWSLIDEASGSRVAIFRPDGQLKTYYVNFCSNNLNYLTMEPTDLESTMTEYYNAYEIYLENGIFDKIQLDEKILDFINTKGVQKLTDGKLTQKTIESEDCLLLKFGDFERILIFNRDQEVVLIDTDGDGIDERQVMNTEKYLFQRVLNIVLLTCSFSDDDRRGEIAIYERAQRPSYADLTDIIANQGAQTSLKKASGGQQFSNFVIEEVLSFTKLPAQYQKLPLNDDLINEQNDLWPGRQSLFVSLLVSLTDQVKFETTNLPLTFQAFLLDKECYENQDPSFFLVRQGRLDQLSKNEQQRKQCYSQLPSSGLRFTIAIKEYMNSIAYQWRSILSPLSQALISHYLSETIMHEALAYERKLFDRIIINLIMVKIRRSAGKNFENWIKKKMKVLNLELEQLTFSDKQGEFGKRVLDSVRNGFLNFSKKFSHSAKFRLETKLFKQSQDNHRTLEEKQRTEWEVSRWRQKEKIHQLQNKIRALQPLYDLWSISYPDQFSNEIEQFYSMNQSQNLNLKKQNSRVGDSVVIGDQQRRSRASHQFSQASQVKLGGGGGIKAQKKDFDEKHYANAYRKITSVKLEKEQEKITEYAQFMRDRLALTNSRQVNPLIETFDLLHLQEVSLTSQIISRPQKIKNKRPNLAPINKIRKGGKQKRNERQFLDTVLKFGCVKSQKVISVREIDQTSSIMDGDISEYKPDTQIYDPLLKLQKKYFQANQVNRYGRQNDQISLNMNLVAYEARLKTFKCYRSISQSKKKGSEAFWNPESKKRMRNVKSAMKDLHKRRQDFYGDKFVENGDTELNQSIDTFQVKSVRSSNEITPKASLNNTRRNIQNTKGLGSIRETVGDLQSNHGADKKSQKKTDLESVSSPSQFKKRSQKKEHTTTRGQTPEVIIDETTSTVRQSYSIVIGGEDYLKKDVISMIDYGNEVGSSDDETDYGRSSTFDRSKMNLDFKRKSAQNLMKSRIDRSINTKKKEKKKLKQDLQLNMDILGINTYEKERQKSQREWVMKSMRMDKTIADKQAQGGCSSGQMINDPWRIKTYAPMQQKKLPEVQETVEEQSFEENKKLFARNANVQRQKVLKDPLLLQTAGLDRKSMTIEEIQELQILARESHESQTDRTCSQRTCNSDACSIQ